MAYPAGYRYKYSNLGYDLLGRIIEQTRGEGFSGYMKANLLNDLGMENSTFNSSDITESETLVKGYEFYKGDYYPLVQSEINSVPSGNLYSTITDLSIFIKSVIRNEVFKNKETISRMFGDHYSRRADPETMGLGWKTTKIRGTELMIWHDGGPTVGIGSLVAILPDKRIGVAIIGNGTSFSGSLSVPFAIDIINHLLTEKSEIDYNPSVKPGREEVNGELLKDYAGKYIAFGMIMNITAKRKKLKGRIGGIGLDLIPVTETEFSITHWMDKIGLTKIFKPPIEFDKIKIAFHTSDSEESNYLIINLDNISFEICPKYPGHVNIPDSWDDLVGEYRMAERLPDNEPGDFTDYYSSINMEDHILIMSGVFGPVLPVDDQYPIIVSGPFAGETLEYFAESGYIIHQNRVLSRLIGIEVHLNYRIKHQWRSGEL